MKKILFILLAMAVQCSAEIWRININVHITDKVSLKNTVWNTIKNKVLDNKRDEQAYFYCDRYGVDVDSNTYQYGIRVGAYVNEDKAQDLIDMYDFIEAYIADDDFVAVRVVLQPSNNDQIGGNCYPVDKSRIHRLNKGVIP